MPIYAAEVDLEIPKGTKPTHHWFASVDGEHYLEVNQDPRPADEEEIAVMFQPRKTANGGYFGAMTMARRFLHGWDATFYDPQS